MRPVLEFKKHKKQGKALSDFMEAHKRKATRKKEEERETRDSPKLKHPAKSGTAEAAEAVEAEI